VCLALAGGACGGKKDDKASSAKPKAGKPGATKKPGTASKHKNVVQKLSLDERRKRLLAMARPELKKKMLEDHPKAPAVPKRDIKQLRTGVLAVGTIKVFTTEHRMEVPGVVTLKPGEIIEYLAVGPKGKMHETVFTLDTDAVHFRLAQTLAGFRPAAPTNTGKPAPLTAESSLDIFVRVGDKPKQIPAALFTVDRATRKPLAQKTWQMTGFSPQTEPQAMREQQFVATRYDALALVNATVSTGNPYASRKTGLAVSKRTPPVGTKVTLILVQHGGGKRPKGTHK